MKLFAGARAFILGPTGNAWPGPSWVPSHNVPGRIHFASRDDLDNFLQAIRSELGEEPQISLGRTNDFLQPVTNSDDLFNLAANNCFLLTVDTSSASLSVDNRKRKSGKSTITGRPETANDIEPVQKFISLTQRYVTQVPIWKRFVRTPAMSIVPRAEQRDNAWKIRVGVWSAAIGGVLGFIGGLVSKVFPG